ncbi:tyrosine-type recombinase/integrase [Paenibacillus sp. FSL R5-0527]|uniref:tyrosine-type recombinase/integrase n=1 Tax=Paenibacillus TaxID=44249 RepID=UPI002DDCA9A5|nr:tyrosine-type recombinase/integrase [Paenibacillus macerans]
MPKIRINNGKGKKERIVPFPQSFKELLAMHADAMKKKHAVYLFESSWKKKYTDRGMRKILSKYSEEAGLAQDLSPHKLRHFLLTWLKKQGIDDALIQRTPATKAASLWRYIQSSQSSKHKTNLFVPMIFYSLQISFNFCLPFSKRLILLS